MEALIWFVMIIGIVVALYYWIFPRNNDTQDDDHLNCGGW